MEHVIRGYLVEGGMLLGIGGVGIALLIGAAIFLFTAKSANVVAAIGALTTCLLMIEEMFVEAGLCFVGFVVLTSFVTYLTAPAEGGEGASSGTTSN